MTADVGRSELLRGIPDFKKKQRGVQGVASVNPVPAGISRQGAVPKNGHEVAREFRKRRTPTEKVAWLATIPEESYAGIFHVEIDAEMLQSILTAIHSGLSQGKSEEASEGESMACASQKILVALARRCRKALDFALSFAVASEKKRMDEVVRLLEKDGANAEDIKIIKDAFLAESSD
eukprot:gnl/MRDRNA2_/MRDRNA2_93438_c0_seq1.p1 gnl/MRDRNA2_/MRDRNA2_93438_c0~~gnl/MRDRNA2_/MRDRNA2_93438_c0_seq1.p1  ORF type:complete len:178 (-),score=50.62 gnl/MRDRNA2_/MRDRNA2_93438_c0_seq1:99-632(-)